MTYKIINQHGKIIDGKERLEIIKTYLLGLEEAYVEQGTANIVEVVVYDNETTINVEVAIFNKGQERLMVLRDWRSWYETSNTI